MALPPPSQDSLVVVTGASSGIGVELARELARRSYNLALVARREDRLTALADELTTNYRVKVETYRCDLGKGKKRGKLIEALHARPEQIVGVCNNAGFGTYGRFQRLDLKREVEEVRVNIEAVTELTGAFLAEMTSHGAGAVLNVASTAGFQPIPKNATYSASKAFVLHFSQSVNADLAGTGVSCTALCPGPVETEFLSVAGAEETRSWIPSFVWVQAEKVAYQGVQAMVTGKPVAIPGVTNKVSATLGRLVPRSLIARIGNRIYND